MGLELSAGGVRGGAGGSARAAALFFVRKVIRYRDSKTLQRGLRNACFSRQRRAGKRYRQRKTTAVAKCYGFGRRSVVSTEGSFGQGTDCWGECCFSTPNVSRCSFLAWRSASLPRKPGFPCTKPAYCSRSSFCPALPLHCSVTPPQHSEFPRWTPQQFGGIPLTQNYYQREKSKGILFAKTTKFTRNSVKTSFSPEMS